MSINSLIKIISLQTNIMLRVRSTYHRSVLKPLMYESKINKQRRNISNVHNCQFPEDIFDNLTSMLSMLKRRESLSPFEVLIETIQPTHAISNGMERPSSAQRRSFSTFKTAQKANKRPLVCYNSSKSNFLQKLKNIFSFKSKKPLKKTVSVKAIKSDAKKKSSFHSCALRPKVDLAEMPINQKDLAKCESDKRMAKKVKPFMERKSKEMSKEELQQRTCELCGSVNVKLPSCSAYYARKNDPRSKAEDVCKSVGLELPKLQNNCIRNQPYPNTSCSGSNRPDNDNKKKIKKIAQSKHKTKEEIKTKSKCKILEQLDNKNSTKLKPKLKAQTENKPKLESTSKPENKPKLEAKRASYITAKAGSRSKQENRVKYESRAQLHAKTAPKIKGNVENNKAQSNKKIQVENQIKPEANKIDQSSNKVINLEAKEGKSIEDKSVANVMKESSNNNTKFDDNVKLKPKEQVDAKEKITTLESSFKSQSDTKIKRKFEELDANSKPNNDTKLNNQSQEIKVTSNTNLETNAKFDNQSKSTKKTDLGQYSKSLPDLLLKNSNDTKEKLQNEDTITPNKSKPTSSKRNKKLIENIELRIQISLPESHQRMEVKEFEVVPKKANKHSRPKNNPELESESFSKKPPEESYKHKPLRKLKNDKMRIVVRKKAHFIPEKAAKKHETSTPKSSRQVMQKVEEEIASLQLQQVILDNKMRAPSEFSKNIPKTNPENSAKAKDSKMFDKLKALSECNQKREQLRKLVRTQKKAMVTSKRQSIKSKSDPNPIGSNESKNEKLRSPSKVSNKRYPHKSSPKSATSNSAVQVNFPETRQSKELTKLDTTTIAQEERKYKSYIEKEEQKENNAKIVSLKPSTESIKDNNNEQGSEERKQIVEKINTNKEKIAKGVENATSTDAKNLKSTPTVVEKSAEICSKTNIDDSKSKENKKPKPKAKIPKFVIPKKYSKGTVNLTKKITKTSVISEELYQDRLKKGLKLKFSNVPNNSSSINNTKVKEQKAVEVSTKHDNELDNNYKKLTTKAKETQQNKTVSPVETNNEKPEAIASKATKKIKKSKTDMNANTSIAKLCTEANQNAAKSKPTSTTVRKKNTKPEDSMSKEAKFYEQEQENLKNIILSSSTGNISTHSGTLNAQTYEYNKAVTKKLYPTYKVADKAHARIAKHNYKHCYDEEIDGSGFITNEIVPPVLIERIKVYESRSARSMSRSAQMQWINNQKKSKQPKAKSTRTDGKKNYHSDTNIVISYSRDVAKAKPLSKEKELADEGLWNTLNHHLWKKKLASSPRKTRLTAPAVVQIKEPKERPEKKDPVVRKKIKEPRKQWLKSKKDPVNNRFKIDDPLKSPQVAYAEGRALKRKHRPGCVIDECVKENFKKRQVAGKSKKEKGEENKPQKTAFKLVKVPPKAKEPSSNLKCKQQCPTPSDSAGFCKNRAPEDQSNKKKSVGVNKKLQLFKVSQKNKIKTVEELLPKAKPVECMAFSDKPKPTDQLMSEPNTCKQLPKLKSKFCPKPPTALCSERPTSKDFPVRIPRTQPIDTDGIKEKNPTKTITKQAICAPTDFEPLPEKKVAKKKLDRPTIYFKHERWEPVVIDKAPANCGIEGKPINVKLLPTKQKKESGMEAEGLFPVQGEATHGPNSKALLKGVKELELSPNKEAVSSVKEVKSKSEPPVETSSTFSETLRVLFHSICKTICPGKGNKRSSSTAAHTKKSASEPSIPTYMAEAKPKYSHIHQYTYKNLSGTKIIKLIKRNQSTSIGDKPPDKNADMKCKSAESDKDEACKKLKQCQKDKEEINRKRRQEKASLCAELERRKEQAERCQERNKSKDDDNMQQYLCKQLKMCEEEKCELESKRKSDIKIMCEALKQCEEEQKKIIDQHKQCESEKLSLEDQVKEIKRKAAEEAKACDQMKKDQEQLCEEIEKLKQSIVEKEAAAREEANKKLQQCESEKKCLEDEMKKCSEAKQEYCDKLEKCESDKKDLEKRLSDLGCKQIELESRIKALECSKTDLETKLDCCQKKSETDLEKLKKCECELAEFEARKKKDMDCIVKQLKGLEEQITKLKDDIRLCECKKDECEKELKSLKEASSNDKCPKFKPPNC